MRRDLEHCDTRAWSILMTGAKEHCDDKGKVHCEDKWHGAL